MDDEVERLKPGAMPADMQSWNIEDLRAYIDSMKAEMSRLKHIAQKNRVQSAAAALFGGVAPD